MCSPLLTDLEAYQLVKMSGIDVPIEIMHITWMQGRMSIKQPPACTISVTKNTRIAMKTRDKKKVGKPFEYLRGGIMANKIFQGIEM